MPASVRPDRLRITDFPDVAPTADIQADGMSNRWITALGHSARTVCLSFSAPLGLDTLAVIRGLCTRISKAVPPAPYAGGASGHRVRRGGAGRSGGAPGPPRLGLNEARTRARYTDDR